MEPGLTLLSELRAFYGLLVQSYANPHIDEAIIKELHQICKALTEKIEDTIGVSLSPPRATFDMQVRRFEIVVPSSGDNCTDLAAFQKRCRELESSCFTSRSVSK